MKIPVIKDRKLSRKAIEEVIYAVNMQSRIDYDEDKAVKMIRQCRIGLFTTLCSAGIKKQGEKTLVFASYGEAKEEYLKILRWYLIIQAPGKNIHFRKFPVMRNCHGKFYVYSRLMIT